jgi:hypothetical protein
MKKTLFTLLATGICLSATAQWSDNPLENNRISPTQWTFVPEIQTTPSGITYLTYKKSSAIGINTYLQIIDQEGKLKYPLEGQLIGGEYPGKSFTVYNDWSFVDRDENLIAIVSDSRYADNSWSYTVFKISPQGEFLWDKDGISLGNGTAHSLEAAIKVIQLEDKSYVFAWEESNDNSSMNVKLQRLSETGEFLWDTPINLVSTTTNYTYPYLANAGNNQFILIYAKGSNYEFYARKMDFDGTPVWSEDTRIYRGGFTVPPHTIIDVAPDYKGGVFFAWYDDRFGNKYESAYVVYVKQDGSLGFITDNDLEGQKVGYVENQRSLRPKIVYDETNEALYVVWESDNSSQTYRSLRIQKLSNTGELLWGEEGKLVVEHADNHSVQLAGEGKLAVFYMVSQSPHGQVINYVALFDSEGEYVWENETLAFSTNNSYKSGLESSPLIKNEYWLASWTDSRDGGTIDNQGVFVQRININGTLGKNETAIQLPSSGVKAELSAPSFIDREARFTLNNPKAGRVDLSVYSVSGQRVAVIYNGILGVGEQTLTWNPQPTSIVSGVYLLKLSTSEGSRTSRIVVK